MYWFAYILGVLLTATALNVGAFDGKKPQQEQDNLPEHYRTGQQIRIENSHYLILDRVRAYNLQDSDVAQGLHRQGAPELARQDIYSIRAGEPGTGQPVLWDLSRQRYGVLLDELGLVLRKNGTAHQLAAEYNMVLTLQLEQLNRAYFRLDADRIPELMRHLQRDSRILEVLPALR